MVLPHDVRLAAENALKSLKADALKVAAKGGPEALMAAEAAQAEGQLPLALGDSTDTPTRTARVRGHAALQRKSTDCLPHTTAAVLRSLRAQGSGEARWQRRGQARARSVCSL